MCTLSVAYYVAHEEKISIQSKHEYYYLQAKNVIGVTHYRLASPGSAVLIYQSKYEVVRLQSSTARSTAEEDRLMIMMISTLSTAMTHHKTSGPLYHHFLSNGLIWVKSMASW